MEIDFDNWYNSYTYGSKLACIKYIKDSDLSKEEKNKRILSHILNLPKDSQKFYRDIYGV